jgi:hypothetical protein
LSQGSFKQRTASQLKRLAFLLMLLLLSAQVDDVWAVAPDLPSAPLADDYTEYLPAQRRSSEEKASSDWEPMFVGLKSPAAEIPLVRKGVPFDWNRTTPFNPPPLYVFMSLQI